MRKTGKMKSSIKQLVIVLILSISLTNIGAAAEAENSVQDLNYNGTDCIWLRTVRDYTVLDDRNLLIHGSGKRSYFVTLLQPSFEIRSSTGLEFSSRDSQVCPYGGDGIVFNGLSREEVRIRSISRVTADQVELLMVRFGRIKADAPKAPAPKHLEGARVEEQD